MNNKSKCSNCFPTRIKSVISKEFQRCDECGSIWIMGRSPNNEEIRAFEMFIRARDNGGLENLAQKVVDLIDIGII